MTVKMNTELIVLSLSVLLGFLQLLLASSGATKQRGLKWNLSSRDETQAPLTGKAARLDRAFQNFKETFPFFLAAVFLVTVTGKSGPISQNCSIVYLTARVVYLPLYVFDGIVVRTLVWGLSALSIVGILLQLAF